MQPRKSPTAKLLPQLKRYWKQTQIARKFQQQYLTVTVKERTGPSETAFAWDSVFQKSYSTFLKLGLNYDSLFKHSVARIVTSSLGQTQRIWDKWLIESTIKKQTEALFYVFLPVQNKSKRTALGLFKLFWLSGALILALFLFL